ncbi:MAG: hypothetical protein HC822_06350, partial [Oscillochloris sp.]|nr:hypothetical protein [Oscillochloris sp.]
MSDPYRQTTHARRSDGLSRLRYSLWLAPEGAILLACLILAEISKFPTLFSITGLVAAFWFIIRMLLIFNAKRAL